MKNWALFGWATLTVLCNTASLITASILPTTSSSSSSYHVDPIFQSKDSSPPPHHRFQLPSNPFDRFGSAPTTASTPPPPLSKSSSSFHPNPLFSDLPIATPSYSLEEKVESHESANEVIEGDEPYQEESNHVLHHAPHQPPRIYSK